MRSGYPAGYSLAAQSLYLDVNPQWLPTASITDNRQLHDYDAIKLVPGSF
ncbi:CTP synthase [Erwinia amylovora MR1]|nr:CTP synthase [Erwinia amylovora MR1]